MGSRAADPPPASHGYGAEVIGVSLRLVQAGVSLRCVPRVLETLCDALGWALPVPHWTTGRLWLLRLGHAVLNAEKKPADDWAWLIDHSVQIGQEKCLVIVGIRLASGIVMRGRLGGLRSGSADRGFSHTGLPLH